MTVSTTTSRIQYSGNAVTLAFATGFIFSANADLVVTLTDTVTGIDTLQVLGTHYTVTGAGVAAGGTVTFLAAPTATQRVTIERIVVPTQETRYVPNDPFPAASHEAALDKVTMLAQQAITTNARSLRLGSGDLPATLTTLPFLTDRVSRVLGFDVNGNPSAGPLISNLDAAVAAFLGGTTIGSIPTVDTVATMVLLHKATLTDKAVLFVTGRLSANDGGGGHFQYSATSTTATDPGLCFATSEGGTGRWKRIYSGSISVLWFAAVGDGTTPDTAAFVAWLAAIAQKTGYIPNTGNKYKLPTGLTISGHSGTRIIMDPFAEFDMTAQVSGYAITMTDCQFCDFDFGFVLCGYSGMLINQSSTNSFYNRIGVQWLTTPGATRQVSKPADPLANRIGIYFQGPTIGHANYYNTLKTARQISGFDTGIALAGNNNANANTLLDFQCEGYWYGLYINTVENTALGGRFYNAAGTDAANISEAVRIGDGSTVANFNNVQAVTEAGAFSRGFNGLAATNGNKVVMQDNSPYGCTDAGINDYQSHNLIQFGSAVNGINGFNSSTVYKVSGIQVLGPRASGWGAASGTLLRAAFSGSYTQSVSAAYVQAEIQALYSQLATVTQTLAALLTDLRLHGVIGT